MSNKKWIQKKLAIAKELAKTDAASELKGTVL